jgi:hypothetical protein
MTTVADWTGAVGIIVVVTGVTVPVNHWVSQLSRNLDYASGISDRFYECANAILDDRRAPLWVSEFLVYLSGEFGSPRLAKWVVENGERFKTNPPPSRFSEDLDRLPEDLSRQLVASIATALSASAAAEPFFPTRLHAKLIGVIEASARTSDDYTPPQSEERDCGEGLPNSEAIQESIEAAEPVTRAVAQYVLGRQGHASHLHAEFAFA